MQNIAVIFGGKTVEHDISIITGLGIIKNLSLKLNIIPIYIDVNGEWWTGEHLKDSETFKTEPKGKQCFFAINKPELCVKTKFGHKKIHIDCAVIALHGGIYEGGAVQGLLDLAGVPYTSPDVLGSALCMDKALSKLAFTSLKVPTPKFIDFEKADCKNIEEKIVEKLKFPVIIKPARCGSSIGITKVETKDDLAKAIDNAFLFDTKVIAEEYLTDVRELNISVFKENGKIHISSIEEVKNNGNIYDFDDKYLDKKVERVVPANVNLKIMDKIIKYAVLVYKKFSLNGVVRFDFLLKDNDIYLNEINTVPGSLAFYLWREQGINFAQLLNINIKNSITELAEKEKIRYSYKSNALACLDKIQTLEK